MYNNPLPLIGKKEFIPSPSTWEGSVYTTDSYKSSTSGLINTISSRQPSIALQLASRSLMEGYSDYNKLKAIADSTDDYANLAKNAASSATSTAAIETVKANKASLEAAFKKDVENIRTQYFNKANKIGDTLYDVMLAVNTAKAEKDKQNPANTKIAADKADKSAGIAEQLSTELLNSFTKEFVPDRRDYLIDTVSPIAGPIFDTLVSDVKSATEQASEFAKKSRTYAGYAKTYSDEAIRAENEAAAKAAVDKVAAAKAAADKVVADKAAADKAAADKIVADRAAADKAAADKILADRAAASKAEAARAAAAAADKAAADKAAADKAAAVKAAADKAAADKAAADKAAADKAAADKAAADKAAADKAAADKAAVDKASREAAFKIEIENRRRYYFNEADKAKETLNNVMIATNTAKAEKDKQNPANTKLAADSADKSAVISEQLSTNLLNSFTNEFTPARRQNLIDGVSPIAGPIFDTLKADAKSATDAAIGFAKDARTYAGYAKAHSDEATRIETARLAKEKEYNDKKATLPPMIADIKAKSVSAADEANKASKLLTDMTPANRAATVISAPVPVAAATTFAANAGVVDQNITNLTTDLKTYFVNADAIKSFDDSKKTATDLVASATASAKLAGDRKTAIINKNSELEAAEKKAAADALIKAEADKVAAEKAKAKAKVKAEAEKVAKDLITNKLISNVANLNIMSVTVSLPNWNYSIACNSSGNQDVEITLNDSDVIGTIPSGTNGQTKFYFTTSQDYSTTASKQYTISLKGLGIFETRNCTIKNFVISPVDDFYPRSKIRPTPFIKNPVFTLPWWNWDGKWVSRPDEIPGWTVHGILTGLGNWNRGRSGWAIPDTRDWNGNKNWQVFILHTASSHLTQSLYISKGPVIISFLLAKRIFYGCNKIIVSMDGKDITTGMLKDGKVKSEICQDEDRWNTWTVPYTAASSKNYTLKIRATQNNDNNIYITEIQVKNVGTTKLDGFTTMSSEGFSSTNTQNKMSTQYSSQVTSSTEIQPFYSFKPDFTSFGADSFTDVTESSRAPSKISENFEGEDYQSTTSMLSKISANKPTPEYVTAIQDYQVRPLNDLVMAQSRKTSEINYKQQQIQDAIDPYIKLRTEMENDPKLDYNGNTFIYNDNKPTLADGVQKDINTMIIQENNLHILGTITLAILLVGVIVMVKD